MDQAFVQLRFRDPEAVAKEHVDSCDAWLIPFRRAHPLHFQGNAYARDYYDQRLNPNPPPPSGGGGSGSGTARKRSFVLSVATRLRNGQSRASGSSSQGPNARLNLPFRWQEPKSCPLVPWPVFAQVWLDPHTGLDVDWNPVRLGLSGPNQLSMPAAVGVLIGVTLWGLGGGSLDANQVLVGPSSHITTLEPPIPHVNWGEKLYSHYENHLFQVRMNVFLRCPATGLSVLLGLHLSDPVRGIVADPFGMPELVPGHYQLLGEVMEYPLARTLVFEAGGKSVGWVSASKSFVSYDTPFATITSDQMIEVTSAPSFRVTRQSVKTQHKGKTVVAVLEPSGDVPGFLYSGWVASDAAGLMQLYPHIDILNAFPSPAAHFIVDVPAHSEALIGRGIWGADKALGNTGKWAYYPDTDYWKEYPFTDQVSVTDDVQITVNTPTIQYWTYSLWNGQSHYAWRIKPGTGEGCAYGGPLDSTSPPSDTFYQRLHLWSDGYFGTDENRYGYWLQGTFFYSTPAQILGRLYLTGLEPDFEELQLVELDVTRQLLKARYFGQLYPGSWEYQQPTEAARFGLSFKNLNTHACTIANGNWDFLQTFPVPIHLTGNGSQSSGERLENANWMAEGHHTSDWDVEADYPDLEWKEFINLSANVTAGEDLVVDAPPVIFERYDCLDGEIIPFGWPGVGTPDGMVGTGLTYLRKKAGTDPANEVQAFALPNILPRDWVDNLTWRFQRTQTATLPDGTSQSRNVLFNALPATFEYIPRPW
jgi:hypothetical protein